MTAGPAVTSVAYLKRFDASIEIPMSATKMDIQSSSHLHRPDLSSQLAAVA